MFQNWGFLLTEMVGLIIIAALIGLMAGWLIWGGRKTVQENGDAAALSEAKRALAACEAGRADQAAKIAALEQDRERATAAPVVAVSPDAPAGDAQSTQAEATDAEAASDAQVDYDGDGILEGTSEGRRPDALSEARDGQPDDLKQIKGIGPKLETLCNALGFFHFDQIAAWTADEIAWVDANLEGFKGRVSRDDWVAQAKVLAEGGSTAFSERVKDGDVYDS